MRVVLFTGKGGVGKTTTAAATAVQAARRGVRTLVMSTDAAHSLGDTLGLSFGQERASGGARAFGQERASGEGPASGGEGLVEVEPGLTALQVSAVHGTRRSWRSVQDYLLGLLATLGIDPVVAEELTSLPGAEEIVALLELRRQVETGPYDLVVVDCAPTAETLRLLALPEALSWHLERLLPTQRGLWRTLRPAAAAASGLAMPGQDVFDAVRHWHDQLREIQAILTSDTTSVRLVLTPERVVVAESRRTLTSLRLYGFAVDQVVVNRVLPVPPRGRKADPWLASWNAAQQAGMVEVHQSFDPLPIVQTPYLAHEPIGADALAALAAARIGDEPDVLTPAEPTSMTVLCEGGGYVLALPLPLVSAAQVDLKRRDDELLVTVGEHRRILSLPSVLRRCVVTRAGVRDGTLRVRFVPDESLWPAAGATR